MGQTGEPINHVLVTVADTAKVRSVSAAVSIKTRANFAGQHILAAAKFARMSSEVETDNAAGTAADPFFTDITAYVTAALLTSAAALEAYINELFIDGPTYFAEYAAGTAGDLWDILWKEVERRPTLDKYGLAAELKKQTGLGKDKTSRSARLLVEVRNALIHFKPQWSDEEKTHQQITIRLLKEPVSASPFGSNSPLFPTDFMSHDMARWAVKTAWQYIEVFSQHVGVPNKYGYLVDELNPGYPTWPVP